MDSGRVGAMQNWRSRLGVGIWLIFLMELWFRAGWCRVQFLECVEKNIFAPVSNHIVLSIPVLKFISCQEVGSKI